MSMQSPQEGASRKPWTIGVAVLAVVIVVVGAVLISQRQKSETTVPDKSVLSELPEDFDLESLQAKKVEYDLACTRIVNGIVEKPAEKLEFPEASGLITLNVDVVFPFRDDADYNMIIEEYRGEKLYKVWIPPRYLRAGTIPLNLDGETFGPGTYRIEVTEEGSDSVSIAVAESMFEVTE
jgi:hypothetical protein